VIRVFVFAPAGLASDAIATALEGERDIEIAGRAHRYEGALPPLPEGGVALVDVGAPDPPARSLIARLHRERPDVRPIVVGVPESPGIVLDYIEAGARGYVRRDESIAGLLAQLRAVARDQTLVPPAMAGLLVQRVAGLSALCAENQVDASRAATLSAREREVAEHVARGRSNQEIAQRLEIGVGTVKNHVHSILRKLNVARREDAGLYWRLFAEKP
jgi:two-component system nitrate/nitrite response regulator NarL